MPYNEQEPPRPHHRHWRLQCSTHRKCPGRTNSGMALAQGVGKGLEAVDPKWATRPFRGCASQWMHKNSIFRNCSDFPLESGHTCRAHAARMHTQPGTCRASATDDGPAGLPAGGTKSGGPAPWGGGHTVSEETQTAAGTGHGTGPGAALQARKGGSNPPHLAKRRRCTPPGAARHGRAGTEVT